MNPTHKRTVIVVLAATVATLGYAGLGAAAAEAVTEDTDELARANDRSAEDPRLELQEALLSAGADEQAPIDRAISAAEAGIGYHLDRTERLPDGAARASLEAQLTNLAHGQRALDAIEETPEPFERGVRLAQLGILWQVDNLDLEAPVQGLAPAHERPSRALDALLERHDAHLDGDQRTAARDLDALEGPTAQALTDLLDAFLALEIAVEELSQALPASTTPVEEQTAVLDLVERVEAGEIASHEEMLDAVDAPDGPAAEAPPQLGDVLLQRVAVLEASLALHKALEGHEGPVPDVVDEPGVIRVDLTGEGTHYEDDYRYIVEAGGSNVYHNNAGGSNVGGGSCLASVGEPTTAALVDLGTADKEFGPPDDYYYCGANGGGFAGFDHGNVGVGMLVTAGGNNTYQGSVAANGGGYGQAAGVGVGLLLDAAGDNELYGGSLAGNGAGANGYFSAIGVGVGLMVLGDGDDVVRGFSVGTNGGALEWGVGPVHGGLISAGGDDTIDNFSAFGTNGGVYTRSAAVAHGFVVNGGGSNTYGGGGVGQSGSAHTGEQTVGTGFLLDADGGGVFAGNHQAVNGATRYGTGAGLLVSGPGDDTYRTNRGTGANGGSHRAENGRAFLVDAGGDDAYVTGRDYAVNGGAHGGSSYGLLLDLEGDDRYVVEDGDESVNGGVSDSGCLVTIIFACVPGSVGVLLDAGGTDWYEDEAGGTGQDKTVVPKGTVGAQIDLVPGPAG